MASVNEQMKKLIGDTHALVDAINGAALLIKDEGDAKLFGSELGKLSDQLAAASLALKPSEKKK